MSEHFLSHIEIPAVDRQAAARFYAELFGWPTDYDPTYDYTTYVAPPGISGAFVAIDGAHGRAGQPLVHITTPDIDATLARVEALGGRTILPKTEVPGIVWFATFADPSGNRLGLSTTVGGELPPSPPTPHGIVHLEIPAADPAAAADFYHQLFGWEHRHDPTLDYTGFAIAGGAGGGFPKIDGQGTRAGHLTIYVWTADIDAHLARATDLGAQVALPKLDIPGVGAIGVFSDPSGVAIGLLAPMALPQG